MNGNTFMDKIRIFLGIQRQEPPQNDFRNPIWGSDDDDDGDELYTRTHMDSNDNIHHEITKQMQDAFEVFKLFSGMFSDMKSFFNEDNVSSYPAISDMPSDSDSFDNNNIRQYYLKPGYQHNGRHEQHEDLDLDGKLSSNDVSGLLKGKDKSYEKSPSTHFNFNLVPGMSFCQTIITTSVTKPDGTVETRKIVKNDHEVIEEITTTTTQDLSGPGNGSTDSSSPINYNSVMADALSSLFRNFH